MSNHRYKKFNYNYFKNQFKHGVYIFVSDSCHFCQEYQKSLDYEVDSEFLYVIEMVTEEERSDLYELTKKGSLPMTVFYYKNKIKKIVMGQFFELQFKDMREYLKELGEVGLSEEEKYEIIEEQKRELVPAFYITMTNIDGCREFLKKKGIAGVCVNELFTDVEDPNERFDYVKSFLTRRVIFFNDPNRTGRIDEMYDYMNLKSLLYCMEYSIDLEKHNIEELK